MQHIHNTQYIQNSKTFISSDHHFLHEKVLDYVPSRPRNHNTVIFNNHNSVVTNNDILDLSW